MPQFILPLDMKSTINIPVPSRVDRGDEVTALWANQISDCIQRLAARNPISPKQFIPKTLLPFEITSANATGLKAAAGVIDSDAHAETVETFASAPSDGTWYLEAKVVIDADTGAITSTAAQWVDTASTATTTDFFYTIGYVEIVTVDSAQSFTITQSNYGPIYVLVHGTYDAKWGATMF